jgi:hypothetical protein
MNRRDFIKASGAAVAATSVLGGTVATESKAQAAEIGPQTAQTRRDAALAIRMTAAQNMASLPFPVHPTNGEEEGYSGYIANYSKALPHNDRGEVSFAAGLLSPLALRCPLRPRGRTASGKRGQTWPRRPRARGRDFRYS